jgi:hypothetical protein
LCQLMMLAACHGKDSVCEAACMRDTFGLLRPVRVKRRCWCEDREWPSESELLNVTHVRVELVDQQTISSAGKGKQRCCLLEARAVEPGRCTQNAHCH